MSIFTYHLVKVSYFEAIKALICPLKAKNTKGLVHIECMSAMILGAPVFSLSRIISKTLVVFAQWEDEAALHDFLETHKLGKVLAENWFVQLIFDRQWGSISGFEIPTNVIETLSDNEPVVAITIARMKYKEIPRFLRWGRPVEKLVRDHPSTTLSLASIRYPNTISTFSIWKSLEEMKDMVQGHSAVPQPKRHINAMKERDKKDFHFEFTTLRFRAVAEFGSWNGKTYTYSNQ